MYNFSIAGNIGEENCGIKNLEINDGAFGKKLFELDGNELEDVRDNLIKSLSKIVLYTVCEDIENTEIYRKIFLNAHIIGVENLKIKAEAYVDKQELLLPIIKMAEAFSIKLVFEIKAMTFEKFDFDSYKKIRSDATGLIFNPNEFVKLKKNPFLSVLYKSKLKDDIVFLRVCDSVYEKLTPVLPEKGNSEIKECASCLNSRSYKGYFAFNDYMDNGDIKSVIDAFTNALVNM